MLAFPSWLHHVVYMCMSVSPTSPKNVHKLSHPDETTCKQVLFRQQAVTAITCTCKQVLFWQQVIMGITYACKQAIFQQQAVMGK